MDPSPTDPGAVREAFAELARGPEDAIDLPRAALLVSAEATPGLDVESYVARVDELAARLAARVDSAGEPHRAVEQLNQLLFEDEGFRGNDDDYYDPRNSFLNDVLDRRRGIPISLSILYIGVARRVGLEARGVGFPGHFLARIGEAPGILVDAFHRSTVTPEECEVRLRDAFGPSARMSAEMLEPAPNKRILMRMLLNLKQIYLRQRELEAALGCAERLLLLDPEAAIEMRDRGLIYQALECHGAALADLERFLELAPGHESAGQVERQLAKLRRRAAAVH